MNYPSTLTSASTLRDLLAAAIGEGYHKIGQAIFQADGAGFFIHHAGDTGRGDLEIFDNPHDAATIALHDDAGAYRPLKTGPNLKRGWFLKLASLADLHLALDLLYPAALANWRALLRGETVATPLRDAVNRQTGMYRVTGLITDEEAQGIVDSLCKPGCLRCIQWPIPSGAEHPQVPAREKEIPLLCTDACSLLIAEARRVVKSRLGK
ncbi:MAG: DR2241 family protein [Spartobacteria bacterium]